MDKLFEILYYSFTKKEYNKSFKITLLLLVLLAPSISIIYMYKRDIFMDLDFAKLLTLGIIINIILFITVYVFLTILSIPKYRVEILQEKYKVYELDKKLKSLERQLNELKDKNSNEIENIRLQIKQLSEEREKITNPYEKQQSEVVNLTIGYISFFIVMIWGLYVYDFIKNIELSNEHRIKRLVIYVIIFILFNIIDNIISLFKYNKNMKIYIKEVENKKFYILKDKLFWRNNLLLFLIIVSIYSILN